MGESRDQLDPTIEECNTEGMRRSARRAWAARRTSAHVRTYTERGATRHATAGVSDSAAAASVHRCSHALNATRHVLTCARFMACGVRPWLRLAATAGYCWRLLLAAAGCCCVAHHRVLLTRQKPPRRPPRCSRAGRRRRAPRSSSPAAAVWRARHLCCRCRTATRAAARAAC